MSVNVDQMPPVPRAPLIVLFAIRKRRRDLVAAVVRDVGRPAAEAGMIVPI